MTTTRVVRTRLNNRTISLAVAKKNSIPTPKDFKEWTWKIALKKLNAKTAKAKKARAEFQKLAGYPVPNGSFRDLITGRVTKVTAKPSKAKTSKAKRKVVSTKADKLKSLEIFDLNKIIKPIKTSKKSSTSVTTPPSKDGSIDYTALAKAIVKEQQAQATAKADRTSRENADRYHSSMAEKRMNWNSMFPSEDSAIKPSSSFKKGEDEVK